MSFLVVPRELLLHDALDLLSESIDLLELLSFRVQYPEYLLVPFECLLNFERYLRRL